MPSTQQQQLLFNSSVECGLRTLCLLFEGYPAEFDLQRLVFFDYLLVHSGDVANGPASIHPAAPFRSNEFLVRRHLIESGVRLLLSRNLAGVRATPDGFLYQAADGAVSFFAGLTAEYASTLRQRAAWVVETFGDATDEQLSAVFNDNLDRWGSEFEIVGELDEEHAQ